MSVDAAKLPEGCPPLNSYYVYLTGGCNLACRHCWIAPRFQANGGTGGHLDYGLFVQAIEEGLPLGLSHVKLTGGEPLLHPDFVRMVDLLKAKDLGLTIETNGTLLTPSLARYLKDKSTLTFITVSLDGAEAATHDAFRGVEGSFNRACQAIRDLVEVGYRPQVIMSVHEGNLEEAGALVQLAESLGAGSVKLGMVQSSGRGEQMQQRGQLLDVHRLIEFGRWVDAYLQPRVSIPVYYNWSLAFYTIRRLLDMDGYTCHIFGILGILHTGQLSMCGIGTQVPDLCYGMLGQDRVADIWTSHPILVALRKQLPKNLTGICGECILRSHCLGMCVAQNYHLSHELNAAHWFCQEVDRAGLFPESRRQRNQPSAA